MKNRFIIVIFLFMFSITTPKPALADGGEAVVTIAWLISAAICGTSIWALVDFKNCEKQKCFEGDNLVLCNSQEADCRIVETRSCKEGGAYKDSRRVFCAPNGRTSPKNSVRSEQSTDLPDGAQGAAIAGAILGGLATLLIPIAMFFQHPTT